MQNEKQVASATKENSQDEKNLLDVFSKMKSKNIPEKSSNRNESIYKDSEHLKHFDGGKKWRNAKRRELLNKFAMPLLTSMKSGNIEKSKDALKKFETFYKENYVSNNFEVSSVYSGSTEKNMFAFWSNFFSDVKMLKSVIK